MNLQGGGLSISGLAEHDLPPSVEILAPAHPLLNQPNQLAADDWDSWVQERGLYFPAEWADGYQPLLRIADPGMEPEDGALLYARCGEGEYLYCALALFRQLRQLNPGACRPVRIPIAGTACSGRWPWQSCRSP